MIMAVDGNSILNRAYYGIRPLSTADGTPTNAVYGFLTTLHRLIKEYKPEGLCVCFDLPGPTFRHTMYDGYKAGRKPMDDALAVQLPIMREVLSALRIPIYAAPGFEADDLLGTISRVCTEELVRCVIVTGDRDSYQLVGTYVSVAYAGTKETSLRTVENITGEYGLTPPQLIDLKALMGDSSDQIPGVPGIGEKSALLLMREFGSLDTIYEKIDSVQSKFRTKLEAGKDSAYLSRELGTICLDAPIGFRPEDVTRREPDSTALQDVFGRLEFRNMLKLWTVNSGHLSMDGGQLTIGNCQLPTVNPQLPEGVGRDVKSIWRKELEEGKPLTPFTDDITIAAWMLGRPGTCWDDMRARMEAEGVWDLYRNVEMPLCRVLARMEAVGVGVDRSALVSFSEELGARLRAAQIEADRLAGEVINLQSPKQIGELLFETLGLPHGKKTKTGYSTNAEVLEMLEEHHEIIPAILQFRELTKLYSTYVQGLLKCVGVSEDGRVHTTYKSETRTGRISSVEPNLQNIPKKAAVSAKLLSQNPTIY
jgi:DNA polymerase-1